MREPAGGVPIIQILAPDDAAWESQLAPESTTISCVCFPLITTEARNVLPSRRSEIFSV